jgi:mRNA interferase MazF
MIGIGPKWLPPMTCRRGEIVLVLFPDSNLRTSKRRPALVVQTDGLGADLPQTVVAMITSNIARAGHPSRVIVRINGQTAEGSGLLMDSVIMTDNLATIHHSEIDRAIGVLSVMTEVDAALRKTLAL